MAIKTLNTLAQRQSADCVPRLNVIESWIGKEMQTFPSEEELHGEALRARPNLPSLARGYVYRMTLGEVARYKAHNTSLNPSAVDAVFSQY